jgi:putative transposase
MARPLRIQFEGAWYHVMNRGTDRCAVFLSDTDRRDFLDLLGILLQTYGAETHAYCLMGNHYHLLVRTPRGNLARAMRHLDGVYTGRFNRREGRDGPLFRGRYHSVLVAEDEHLLAVSRYIHRNPLEAGLVADPAKYPWSSLGAYCALRTAEPWLHRSTVLDLYGGASPRGVYQAHVDAGPGDLDYEPVAGRPIFGSEGFSRAVTRTLRPRREIPTSRRLAPPPPPALERILEVVAAEFGVDIEQLCRPPQGRGRHSPGRALAMLLCREVGGHPLQAIAAAFRVGHYASVSRAIRAAHERLEREPELDARRDRIRATLAPFRADDLEP